MILFSQNYFIFPACAFLYTMLYASICKQTSEHETMNQNQLINQIKCMSYGVMLPVHRGSTLQVIREGKLVSVSLTLWNPDPVKESN